MLGSLLDPQGVRTCKTIRFKAPPRDLGVGAGKNIESGCAFLKHERIRRRTYCTRDAARQNVFDYIEIFYNPKRKHTNNGMLSLVDCKIAQKKTDQAGI